MILKGGGGTVPISEVAISSGGTASESSMTSGGQMLEFAIPADDSENLADGGPAEIGRADVHLEM